MDNRVRLTPRLDDQESNGCNADQSRRKETATDCDAEGYFENLRKRLRLDNGSERGIAVKVEETNTKENESTELPKRPFDGVVAFIHKKVEDQRTDLVRAVESLGGEVRFQHSEEVTHFVYQGKLAASKEIKNGKEWHQKFVSPQWILDCEDASIRLEESQYPPYVNPKMALTLNFSSQPTPHASSTQKRRFPASNGTPKASVGKRKVASNSPNENDMTQVTEEPEPLVTEMEEEACKELLQLDQVLSRSAEQVPLQKVANVSAVRSSRGSDHMFVPATQPLESVPDSQAASVVWDLHETQKVFGSDSPPVYRIMFSGMTQGDRDSCSSIIEVLGGTVLEANQYDPTCTHLVVAKVGGNEKLLTSIAAGKWVLQPEWLSESEKENRFLDEQKFEWGNPANIVVPSEPISDDEANIAAAAYYWRVNRSRGISDGPFHGIVAVLYLRDKNASFQRLLEAGGGEVVEQE